ncbi:MAG: thioesterase domain-containing protein [Methylocella sp.]
MDAPTTERNKHGRWIIDILTTIWERVLNCSGIGPHDNFFELGGDAQRAAVLFDEIEKITGRRLVQSVINDVPTIAGMADILEAESAAESSPLVLIKSGADAPPLFLAYGFGGNVMELWQIGDNIRSGHPIYAVHITNRLTESQTDMRHVAQLYYDIIKEFQPKGPYFLAGLSFGGLAMMEVAHRLIERGETIACLIFLDTFPHPRYWPHRSWVRILRKRVKHHLARLRQLSLREIVPYVVLRLQYLVAHLRRWRGTSSGWTPFEVPPAIKRARDITGIAWANYRPRFFPGRITFIQCQDSTYFPDDPRLIWEKLVQDIEICTVPGSHLSMITSGSALLAEQLSSILDRIDAK